jgi:hypothetical protein
MKHVRLVSGKDKAMNELNIYEIFKSVFQKSKVIEGRFYLLKGYGNDLNSDNLGESIKETIGTITAPKKYPLVGMMPPYEIVENIFKNWSRFKINLFFCVPKNANNGQVKSPNSFNNTSNHTVEQDWKDMRECAGDFRGFLYLVLKEKELFTKIRIPSNSIDAYQRYSNVGNDALSVVSLSFDIEIAIPCDIIDYAPDSIDTLDLTNALGVIHPSHKH